MMNTYMQELYVLGLQSAPSHKHSPSLLGTSSIVLVWLENDCLADGIRILLALPRREIGWSSTKIIIEKL